MLGEAMKTRRQRHAMRKQKGSRARKGHGDSANRGRGRVADMAYRTSIQWAAARGWVAETNLPRVGASTDQDQGRVGST
jgi:hypothetical protein